MSDDGLCHCRWGWCRRNFSNDDALGNHVIFEHVRRAIPVRRREIPMILRAEEGLGDSLDIMKVTTHPASLSLPSPPTSHDIMSEPPSQLHLSSPLYHIHRTRSPSQLQNTPNTSSLSLPLNPVALSPPTGFAFSTPQGQTWYQSASLRRRISRSTSGGTTPKPSESLQSDGLPTVSEEQSQLPQSSSSTRERGPPTPQPVHDSPLTKKSVFRSGTLHLSTSPLRQGPPRPQTETIANEGTDNIEEQALSEKSVTCDTQSQFEQQSTMDLDISYPILQTQAPYQSQSLSELD